MAKRVVLDGDAFERRRRENPTPWVGVFVAPWCQPCERLLARLSSTVSGDVDIAVVDVDREPQLAERYGVRGMPTLCLFVDGEMKAMRVGMLSEPQLAAFYAEMEKS
ncbi:thioredoxin family protein [Salinicola halophilus]|uniref:thioredoxin family protein n=1 Tax=Salinicola halophilus TaxID=184065 RepID=UPI000DA1EC9C|nr:thioredoxin domain-containing protein [Salinicola halophilus]